MLGAVEDDVVSFRISDTMTSAEKLAQLFYVG
jgi:hypothetical protein